jgi:hypothetical protein
MLFMPVGMLILGSLVMVPVSHAMLVGQRDPVYRRRFVGWFLTSLFVLGGIWIGGWYRHRAFVRLAETMRPLIVAIEAYRVDRGKYPRAVEELRGRYLHEVPVTGM